MSKYINELSELLENYYSMEDSGSLGIEGDKFKIIDEVYKYIVNDINLINDSKYELFVTKDCTLKGKMVIKKDYKFIKNVKNKELIFSDNIDEITEEIDMLLICAIKAEIYKETEEHYFYNTEIDLHKSDEINDLGNIPEILGIMEKTKCKVIDDFLEKHTSETVEEDVFILSNTISKKLKKHLLNNINKIIKYEEPDYHPMTNNIVRDIVHPSIRPYIVGRTILEKLPALNKDYKIDIWGRKYETSKYQWIPTYFYVKNGKCHTKESINNLDKEKYPDLHNGICELFGNISHYFDDMYKKAYPYDKYSEYDGNKVNCDKEKCVNSFNGKYGVITKIAEYNLDSNEEFNGVWHVEGMTHEHIFATAVYVIEQTSNLDTCEINFRRTFTHDEIKKIYDTPYEQGITHVNSKLGSLINPSIVRLGKLKSKEDTIFIFPNSHIHKVSKLINKSNLKGRRKIIVFFVIDPNHKVITMDCIKENNIIWSDAKKHQLELMKERKYNKEKYNEREISLCEH